MQRVACALRTNRSRQGASPLFLVATPALARDAHEKPDTVCALRTIALRPIEAVAEDHLRSIQLGTAERVVAGVQARRDQYLAGEQPRAEW
jgi:hypothetical protein